MMKAKWVVTILACGMLAGYSISAAQEDDAARPAQRGEEQAQQNQQSQKAFEDVWKQVAQTHRTIVEMEVARIGKTGDQPQREGVRSEEGERPRINREERPRTEGAIEREEGAEFTEGRPQTEQLWVRLGTMHQQLVQLKIAEQSGSAETGAARPPAADGAVRQPVREQDENAPRNEIRREGETEAGAAQQNPRVVQLERQINDLYGQILQLDLAHATGRTHRVARPPFNEESGQPQQKPNSTRPKLPKEPRD